MKFLQKLRLAYGDMKLSSKFTLVLMITATIPVIMMAGFFYGRLYDMVVSYQQNGAVRQGLHRPGDPCPGRT